MSVTSRDFDARMQAAILLRKQLLLTATQGTGGLYAFLWTWAAMLINPTKRLRPAV